MKSKNCYAGVNHILVQQIRFQANRLKQKKCMAYKDIEDIEQELLCKVWSDLDQYDESRGAYSTFVAKLVQSRANNLLYEQKYVCPVSDISNDIPDIRSSTNEIVLKIDVNDIILTLPKQWQNLCEQLKFFNLVEVARMNNMSRTTLYCILRKLRIRFGPLYRKK